MRGDMKWGCKGAKIHFELDMRHRSFAVEAVPMGKPLTGSLTHALTLTLTLSLYPYPYPYPSPYPYPYPYPYPFPYP